MFKYSSRDGLLVILSLGHIVSWVIPIIYFEELSALHLVSIAIVNIVLMCTNYQCIAHNFIHNPFFKQVFFNRFFSIINSLAMGMPQSIYKAHHINHHVHNNDKWQGELAPLDKSSLYYYGENNQEEGVFKYTFLSYFRLSLWGLFSDARQRVGLLVVVELVASLAFFGALLWINPMGFALFVIPVHYIGTSLASLENYAEHHLCEPDNDLSNSVSCYSKLYNILWFNNGYHQEHHFKPDIHWTKLPEAKPIMLPENERHVVKGFHFMSLFTRNN
jgi:fatty acid desaturase